MDKEQKQQRRREVQESAMKAAKDAALSGEHPAELTAYYATLALHLEKKLSKPLDK